MTTQPEGDIARLDALIDANAAPIIEKMLVSAAEYAALLNVDQMVRVAMTAPDSGEFLAGAIMALDAVRKAEAPRIVKPNPNAPMLAIWLNSVNWLA